MNMTSVLLFLSLFVTLFFGARPSEASLVENAVLSKSQAGFTVNSITYGDQIVFYSEMQENGSFEIHWADGLAITYFSWYGQRFDATGGFSGEELPVYNFTPPSLAKMKDGTYLQVFISRYPYALYYRRLSEIRSIISENYLVTTQFATYVPPVITATTDGSFLIGWNDGYTFNIQRFDSSGQPVGSRILSNINFSGLAMAQDGSFAAIWRDAAGILMLQLFDSSGNPLRRPVAVNNKYSYNSSIAMAPNGSYVTAWSALNAQGTDYDVYASLFIAPPLGTEEPTTQENPDPIIVTEEPPVAESSPQEAPTPAVTEEHPIVDEDFFTLADKLLSSNCISNLGVANAVRSSYSNAISLKDKNRNSAKNILDATISLIEAQRGKNICSEGAGKLIENIKKVIAGL